MDIVNDCQLFKGSNDMQEGELYVVKSDKWEGAAPWERRPAECVANFNFGDRLIEIDVSNWWCKGAYKDPFFALYSDCIHDEDHLLVGDY